jgi:DNA gyrase subunit A
LLLEPNEKVTAALPVRKFDDAEYLAMVTRNGRIKRVAVKSFENVRSNGLIAISLDDGDELAWVKMTTGDQDVILVSKGGKAIRFSEDDVRPMGRTAAGVNAIRLVGDDHLAGCDIVDPGIRDDAEGEEVVTELIAEPEAETAEGEALADDVGDDTVLLTAGEDDDLLIITEYGYGKRTPISEFRQQNRYGQGVRAMNLDEKRTGRIVSARMVRPNDEVTVITSNGIILRTAVGNISQQGRYSQGVRIMEMKKKDAVASVAVIPEGADTPDALKDVPAEETEITSESAV